MYIYIYNIQETEPLAVEASVTDARAESASDPAPLPTEPKSGEEAPLASKRDKGSVRVP